MSVLNRFCFEVLPFASGGFADVYLGNYLHIDKKVIAKVPRRSLALNVDVGKMGNVSTQQFLSEANLVYKLSGVEGIAELLDCDVVDDEGHPWFGMPVMVFAYVEGQTLREWLDAKPGHNATSREAAEIVLQICRALQGAHDKGVSHNDIKPTNIIVQDSGNHLKAIVIDWGIGARLGDAMQWREGIRQGTPKYMAPEQASGRAPLFSPQSDQYSLGVLLTEMLTGQHPYPQLKSRMEIANAARSGAENSSGITEEPAIEKEFDLDFLAPLQMPLGVPQVLAEICRTSLRLQVEERRGLDWVESQLTDWLKSREGRRHRTPQTSNTSAAWPLSRMTLSTIAILVCILCCLVVASLPNIDPQNTRHNAVIRPHSSATGGRDASPEIPSSAFRRPVEPRLLPSSWSLVRVAPPAEITAATWSPDGQFVAYGTRLGDLRICTASTLEPVQFLTGHRGGISQISWRNDGEQILTCSADRTIRQWNRFGQLLRTIPRGGPIGDVAWQPGGQKFASVDNSGAEGLNKGRGVIWDKNGEELASFVVDKFYSVNLAWSADGRRLATCGGEFRVRFWNEDGTSAGEAEPCPNTTTGMTWNRQGVLTAGKGLALSFLVPGSRHWRHFKSADTIVGDGSIWNPDGSWHAAFLKGGTAVLSQFSDPQEGDIRRLSTCSLTTEDDFILRWHPTAPGFLTAGSELRIWEFDRDQLTANVVQRREVAPVVPVHVATWQPHGTQLCTAGGEGQVRLFSEDTWESRELVGHTGTVLTAAWSNDGRWLASGGADQSVRFWTEHGERGTSYSEFGTDVLYLAWSRQDNWLAVGGHAQNARLYHPQLGLGPVLENQQVVAALAWNPQGERLAVGLAGITGIQIWERSANFRTWTMIHGGTPCGLRDHVHALSYGPKTDQLGAGSAYGRAGIYAWSQQKWTPLQIQHPSPYWLHRGSLKQMAWSPQGDKLASADNQGVIGLWTATGQHLATLSTKAGIRSLRWSPDARWLAAGDVSGAVHLWDFVGNDSRILNGNLSEILTLDWSADSTRLAWGTDGGMLRLMDAKTGRILRTNLFVPGGQLVELDENGRILKGETASLESQFLYRTIRSDGTVQYLSPVVYASSAEE